MNFGLCSVSLVDQHHYPIHISHTFSSLISSHNLNCYCKINTASPVLFLIFWVLLLNFNRIYCVYIILPKKHLICSFQANSFILLLLIIKMAGIIPLCFLHSATLFEFLMMYFRPWKMNDGNCFPALIAAWRPLSF